MSTRTMKEVLETAREIYGKAEDFNAALEYIDGSIGELVQELVNVHMDSILLCELTRVGLNPLGDVVMLCEVCQETYVKTIQGKTLKELLDLRAGHKCEKIVGRVLVSGESTTEVEK